MHGMVMVVARSLFAHKPVGTKLVSAVIGCD